MNLSSLNEVTPNDRLLTSLVLAVDEARMVRSLLQARESSLPADANGDRIERLTHLDHEIEYLEAKLIEIKSKTNRALDWD